MKTDLSTDLFGGFAGKAQFPLGMGDADIQKVIVDGNTKLFLEDSGEIIFVDEVSFGEIVERYFLRIILVKILPDMPQAGTFGMCRHTVRMPAILHQQG